MPIIHTSAREFGQIYIPAVNWVLMGACIVVVLGFQTSSNLAAAYGVAVTSTMAITTVTMGAVFLTAAAREEHVVQFFRSALLP